MPFATSFTEPSPPTTTSSVAPSSAACRARPPSSPGALEKSVSPLRPAVAARCAISGHRRPVAPLSDAGLTRKTTLSGLMLRVGGDRVQCDAGHPVDGCTQLLVADPLELALDHDVADVEQAARLHLAQRAEREQDRRLHLDREDAAVRPALVLLAVRVIEDV